MNILVTSYQRCYMNCRIYNQGHESTKIDQRRTIRRRERDCNQDKRCHGCRSKVGSSGSFGMVIIPIRCDFNGTKASADSEERSVSVGSRHPHRSPGQEDTKVVRHGQMDNYYERFCETVAMGLPGRVIYLDVVGLEHEADHRMTRNRRGRDMKLSQRLLDMKKKHWEFCSQYCQMLHCLLPVQATRS